MYSLLDFSPFGDPVFGVVWLMWSFLWTLFFTLLALKREIGRFTAIGAEISCVIPACLLLTGVLPLGGYGW